jgi:small subunit ribosomal protein S2
MVSEEVQVNNEEGLEKTAPESGADVELMRAMTAAGLFYGRKKAKTHPRMRKFIFATRSGVEVINLADTAIALATATELLSETVKNGKQVLVVGTQPAAQAAVETFAKQFNFPYVTQRWLGGTLTNFGTISKRIEHFKMLKESVATGAFQKYTKREQLQFAKEMEDMEVNFAGLVNLTKTPDVLFVVGVGQHMTAIREAKRMRVPVVAVINTESDPTIVQYPIPANDLAISSVEWIMKRIGEALSVIKK